MNRVYLHKFPQRTQRDMCICSHRLSPSIFLHFYKVQRNSAVVLKKANKLHNYGIKKSVTTGGVSEGQLSQLTIPFYTIFS